MRGLEPLQFVALGKGATKRLDNLDNWLMYWWGDTLDPLDAMVWFEKEQRGDNLLWTPYLEAMETTLDLLLEDRIKRTYKTHTVVIPRLLKFLWGINMGNGGGLLFTIPVGMLYW